MHPITDLLNPGELIISSEPKVIRTILGSCISLIFYHRATGFYGMTHALLPTEESTSANLEACETNCQNRGKPGRYKYVSCSTSALVEAFRVRGIPKREIEVKLFGGAKTTTLIKNDIGARNVLKAKDIIQHQRLSLYAEDTFGVHGRIIQFDSTTGDVHVRIRGDDVSSDYIY